MAAPDKLVQFATLLPLKDWQLRMLLIIVGALATGLMTSIFLISYLIDRDQQLNAEILSSYFSQTLGGIHSTPIPAESYKRSFDHTHQLNQVSSLRAFDIEGNIQWASHNNIQTRSYFAFKRAVVGKIAMTTVDEHQKMIQRLAVRPMHRFYANWVPTIYLPIRNLAGKPITIVEITRYPIILFSQLGSGLLVLWSVLAICSIVLLLFSYRLFRTTSNQLVSCEVDLEKSRRLAEVGECVSMIVHDTRNLMGSIRFIFERLRNDKMDAEQRRAMIQRANRPLEMSFAMMEDLLGFVSGKKIPLQCHRYNLSELIDEGRDMLAAMLETSGHTLKVNIPEDVIIYWDSQKLLHILVNLVRNAAEAMEKPGTVTLDAERIDGGVRLHVRDTGNGIAEDILPRLFEPFVSETNKTRPGLGLAIIRDLVRRHGGEITARNQTQGGAEFELFFPDCPHPQSPGELATGSRPT